MAHWYLALANGVAHLAVNFSYFLFNFSSKSFGVIISLVSFLAFPFFSCTRMFRPKKLARELKASSSKNCDVKLLIIPDLTKVLYIQKNCWAKTDLQQN